MGPVKPPAKDPNIHQVLFDPSDARPDFIGTNQANDATTTATDWDVWRFEYSTTTSSKIIKVRRATGAYDDRATLLP